jgi:5-methylcytosine-specific restriction endonuclease McrA
MRLCSGAGCGRKIPEDVRFCDECKPSTGGNRNNIHSHTNADREKLAHLYRSDRWERVAKTIMRKCALCARCKIAPSALVDHKVPAGIAIAQAQASGKYPFDKWAGFFLQSNLEGLCRSCHGVKTLEDKTHVGEWPDVVAIEAAAPKKVWSF